MSSKSITPTKSHREIWRKKRVLRLIYGDYYQRISQSCVEGRTLEVGGGSGNFRGQHQGDVVSMDIQELPWLDVVGDAHRLPFTSGSISNIVLVDTLHHLQNIPMFLDETKRVLSPGGRLVMIEPAITPISYLVYHFMHPEPVRLSENPLADAGAQLDPNRNPFDSNQAIPTLLFERNQDELRRDYPELKVIKNDRFSLFTFVLSGGLRRWSLMPSFIVPVALRVESLLTPLLKNLMAFRLMVVVERQ